ncbi:hypothetical protein BD311DRAFT_352293 [Dichomitus squalens]|uniref:Uncharacterized protein n=1 Tax=Dichomitus squalens TaxID=114155 RepID=A0A4Q9N526_9APHY|nr:hypothetical protein BD311DRAFT_352293 [Dichomitus squalens]
MGAETAHPYAHLAQRRARPRTSEQAPSLHSPASCSNATSKPMYVSAPTFESANTIAPYVRQRRSSPFAQRIVQLSSTATADGCRWRLARPRSHSDEAWGRLRGRPREAARGTCYYRSRGMRLVLYTEGRRGRRGSWGALGRLFWSASQPSIPDIHRKLWLPRTAVPVTSPPASMSAYSPFKYFEDVKLGRREGDGLVCEAVLVRTSTRRGIRVRSELGAGAGRGTRRGMSLWRCSEEDLSFGSAGYPICVRHGC